ncbi:hypothetical protein [Thiomicrorhabdus aquaedulcis]|uniref:hypothetical protein n=1 Tax=Thiomicrorhabdus aquaedulcis TaxID=2211106 RepID=UPI00156282A4|nr:hypothetical protein [Thiomicrorhabdus aquaedulcis]
MAGIASRAGLKLAFGQPRTDGRTVWVSDIPLNPSVEDYNSVVSDLIHEVGHIKFTDFSCDRTGHPLMPALTNVFEDVRIEHELEREFLGAQTFLNEGYKASMNAGTQRKPDTAANALTMWLILDHMIKVNHRSFFAQSRDEAYQACLDFGVSQDLMKDIETLCDARVSKLSSTADVVSLSKEVVALLQSQQEEDNEPEDNEPGNAPGDSDSQQDSQDDSSDGQGDDSNSQQDSNASDSSDAKGSDSQSGSQGAASSSNDGDASNSSGSSSDSSTSSGADELLNSDVREQSPISLREAAQAITDNANAKSSSLKELLGHSDDVANELRQMNGEGSSHNYRSVTFDDIANYNVLKNSVSKDIQILKNRLIKRWQNTTKTRSIVNENDGRFSVSDAIRCSFSGEDNYLVKKGKATNHKPAVCILADLSGSMSNVSQGITLLNYQTTALIALTEACNAIGIAINILGFDDCVVSLKKWNEPMSKSRAVLGGLNTLNSTRLERGVFEGVRALKSRKESKKILITLTDGDVGVHQKRKVRSIMDYAPDVEYYGLGIGVNIDSIFENGGKVSPENIAESLLAILSK